MRLANNTNLHPILYVFELPLSSDQIIIAFVKGVPIVNALVLGNLGVYRRTSHIAIN